MESARTHELIPLPQTFKMDPRVAGITGPIPKMTQTGKTSDPILTEEVYCPRHALTYQEAYNQCDKHYAYAIDFEQWRTQLEHRHEYWFDKSKQVSGPRDCTACVRAQVAFCCDMSLKWLSKWISERDKSLARSRNEQLLGPREFTLTYSPTWFDAEEAKRTMTQAIERLTRYYKHEIIEFHAIGEYTSSGNPHIHAFYLLAGGRKITDKNFKRAYPRWNPKKKLGRGFEGGHHETVDRISDFAGYTEKHLDEAWLNIHISNGAPEILNPSPSSQSSQEDDA